VAPTVAASSAAPSAASDGFLRVVGTQVITNLDPRTSLGPDGVMFRRNVFHTLLHADPASGEITPLLSPELPTKESDTSYLVKIRSGLKWHDGTDVTADDLKYTVDWMQDPKNNSIFGSVVLDGVTKVDVVDPTSVRFTLSRPIGSFVERLATIAPVPRKAATELGNDKFKIAPVGLGPFKFSEFVANDHESFERWDGYTMGPKPSLAKVEFREILEGTARATALQTGQADVDMNPDPALFGFLESTGLKTLISDHDAGYNGILLNNGTKPFSDVRVRQAMAHAIDRDELVQAVWSGYATPMYGPLPPWHPMADPNIPRFEHNPDKAKALLAQAGYANGCEFELMQGVYSTGLQMAAVLQKQLEAAGFKVNIKTGDAEGLYSFVFDKTWQAFSMRGNTSIIALYPDIMTRWTLQSLFNNASEADLAELTKALQAADAIPADQVDLRKAAYAKIQAMYAADQRMVYLVNVKNLSAFTSKVQGITFGPDETPNELVGVTLT
jgi:peptide/nickel transport system substrate-binding protein